MSNSYGFNGTIPAQARYGIYDNANGEWTGRFFSEYDEAEAELASLDDDAKENYSVEDVENGDEPTGI